MGIKAGKILGLRPLVKSPVRIMVCLKVMTLTQGFFVACIVVSYS